ncbi:MAG: FecR domain-containing protein, partial [Candidatus Hydrogenedentales bacterium]
MSEHDEQYGMPDGELERLLKSVPAPPRMDPARKKAIWLVLEARLALAEAPKAARPRRWGRLATAAAVAAVFVLCVPLWLTLRGNEVLGHVAVVHGTGYSESGEQGVVALAANTVLKAGQRIQAGPGSGVKLALADGTTLWLCESTQVVCVGPRSAKGPALRLIEGEVRAEVTPGPPEAAFSVETPAATLRVLGTRFNCKLYAGGANAPGAQSSEDSNMKQLRAALRSALVLTVLSGAVEVHANNATQTVEAGSRSTVLAQQTENQEALGGSAYTAKWLGDPGPSGPPEALVFQPIRDYFLYAMWAVDVQTGKAREVTDFMSATPRLIAQLGSGLALVNASSVIFPHFSSEPVGGSGRPFINDALFLVNLATGEKMAMTPLADYDPLYMELSPDRRKLAFVGSHTPDKTKPGEREGGVYVLDLETLDVKRVLEGWQKTCPHWSPDSRWLAIADTEGYVGGGNYGIVLIDTVTQNVVPTGLNGAGVLFTRDGKSLIYSSGFKRDGSWSAGVPTWGNLFMTALPDGKPESLTALPEGGAINPSLSPDGTQLAYWVASAEHKKPATLHLLDLAARTEQTIGEGDAYGQVTWLDGGTRIVLTPQSKTDEETTLKIVSLKDGVVESTAFTPEIPETTQEVKDAQAKSTESLLKAFVLYRQAVDAQDFHRVDEAVAKYHEAWDELDVRMLSFGLPFTTLQGLLVGPEDFRPYVEAFSELADLDATGLSVRIVRENLEWYVSSVLDNQFREEKTLPTDLPAFVKETLSKNWQTNHIRSSDTERVKRLFVVPGD